MLTLNEIVKQLTDIADAHDQIAAYGVGDLAEWNPTERNYPLMWVHYVGANTDEGVLSTVLRVGIFDRVHVGEEGEDVTHHEQEVLSDTQLIILDVLAYFVQGHQTEYYSLHQSDLTPATEQMDDRVAGHFIDITVSQNWDFSKCQIPANFGSPASTVDGLTLYDFCDAAVFARLTQAQRDCLTTELCGACDDATVENNATPTWSQVIASGATYTLPQAKMLDSDGVTEVLADYIPSASGTMFTATPCAAIPSIAVALDDSTPVIGDEIIITVTPTNTTPTEYIYIVEYNSTMELLEYSASPTCNWTVSVSGAFEIFVLTNESGTKKVYNSATGTATGFLFDNYGTADAVGYSFDRLRGAYSGPIVTIRRSSDNAEEDFYLNASNTFDMTSETSGGTSLSTWIGSDSGYITTRYDQGLTAKHRTQTTQAAQPMIVDAGTLVTRGGKAALYYDGTDDEFISAAAIGEADVDCWYIFEPDADTIYIHQHSSGSAYGLYCRDGNTSTTIHSNYGSPTFRADGAAITIANRNEAYDKTTPRKLVAHLGADLTLWSTYDVGYYGGGGLSSTGWEQDYIIYPSGGTSAGDITGIEDDINTRFSLY